MVMAEGVVQQANLVSLGKAIEETREGDIRESAR